MQNKITPNKDHIKKHLELLFKDCRGYDDGKIEIAYTPNNTSAVNKAEFFDVLDIEEAAEFAYQKNLEEGTNVYVGAALRTPDTAPFGRSNLNDYYASYYIWCDIDEAQAAKTAKNKYKDLPPSFVIVTGREPNLRAQLWWKLQTPEEEKELLKSNLAHICNALDGDPAVVDPARVMRLGGTIAYPKKEGRVIECTELVVPPNPTKMIHINKFSSYFPISENKPIKSHVANNNFKNRITGTFEIEKLLEASRQEGKWHVSMRDAICSMVGKGWSDEQIRIATNPYRRDRSLVDDMITPLIYSARNKFNHPEPTEKVINYNPETGEIIEGEKRQIPFIYANDITATLDTKDFVENLLRENEFSVIYGESNCGKTFFMLDLAMHVALGMKWRGLEVEQGGVIYAALEGGHGTKNRIIAFKQHHNITDNIPLAIIPSNLNFLDTQGDLSDLAHAIEQEKTRLGGVKLIVIDTLARAISGGDENSSMDMGQLIINADILRSLTGSHIAFIHHSGKDTAKGARGHSSLRAAVDTEIEISRENPESPSLIKVVKQREMEMIDDMAFTLSSTVLGVNKRGKEVTSCIVIPSEIAPKVKTATMNPTQTFIYDALIGAIDAHGQDRFIYKDAPPIKCVSYDELRLVLEFRGFKKFMETEKKTTAEQIKSATQTARLALKKMGKINFDGNFIWVIYE